MIAKMQEMEGVLRMVKNAINAKKAKNAMNADIT